VVDGSDAEASIVDRGVDELWRDAAMSMAWLRKSMSSCSGGDVRPECFGRRRPLSGDGSVDLLHVRMNGDHQEVIQDERSGGGPE
jgi:hypothetical protein